MMRSPVFHIPCVVKINRLYFFLRVKSIDTFVCITLHKDMKDEIFRLLKQEYSPLGLGDAYLQARAEMLDALGFVTAENVADVVAKQRTSLEAIQKLQDSRVTEALKKRDEEAKKKAEEEAKKKAEADAKKAAEEAAKKAEEERLRAEEEAKKKGGLTDELKAYLEELNKAHREEMSKQKADYDSALKTLTDSLKTLNDSRAAEQAAKAKADRQAKILNKAKELGIPQSRIDEGFLIADDADDVAIGSYLSGVKKNIDAQKLPSVNHLSLGDGEPKREDIAEIAEMLVG